MTAPRIEIGNDETGKRWCIYVEGVPSGPNYHHRSDAKLVADWILRGGAESIVALSPPLPVASEPF